MTLHVAEPRVGYALKGPDDVGRLMSAEEFLAWDELQPERWEYVRGEVFLMTGGADRNYTVSLNLAIALRQHLRGTPCRVYGSDIKLRVDASNCFFYPDLMVTCSARDARTG
jgi:Uma2 family endonuclease